MQTYSGAIATRAWSQAPPPFDIEIRPRRQRVIVAPRGELDCATVDRLQAAIDDLAASGWTAIVLDLRTLSFMDSTGVNLIVRLASRIDVAVQLIDGIPSVARLFDLTGLRARLPFIRAHDLRLG